MSLAILRSSPVDQRAFRRAMLAVLFAGGVALVV
jgi:hypothetical protein